MKTFEKFKDWESKKYVVAEDKKEEKKDPSTAELISELEDLSARKKKAVKEQDSYESQILEIEIKLKKLEIERSELLKKQKDLSEARDIAKKKNIEGRSHDQE